MTMRWVGIACLTVMAAVAGLLVGANVVLTSGNRDLQVRINQRQQFINDSSRLNVIHRQMIDALANLSARTGDTAIRDMLAANGITFEHKTAAGAGQ